MSTMTSPRLKRNAKLCPSSDPLAGIGDQHLELPAVRRIVRRTGFSPSLAFILAELAGLFLGEARHG